MAHALPPAFSRQVLVSSVLFWELQRAKWRTEVKKNPVLTGNPKVGHKVPLSRTGFSHGNGGVDHRVLQPRRVLAVS